ncbi:MAG: hypothetical protein HZB47_04395 [Nitrosomonadales bacterium]|nr:hypothetical protein [Nitrosomonadales bacterium]
MLTTLRREYAQFVTSGGQLILLLVGIKLESRIGWLWCLGCMSAVSLFAWYSALHRLRAISGTPTSRIASAAQGYVELTGRGRPGPIPLISKLRVLPCLWYRWKVEQRNSKNQWSTLDKGESSDYFVLRDNSGECVVDPGQAEIITKHRDEWSDGSYRYTEWKLIRDDLLYVIGEFKTIGGSGTPLTHDDFVKQVLAEWKMDNADLLKRFDLDNNGELDMREWMLARSAAKREAEKRLDQARSEPDTNFMLKPNASLTRAARITWSRNASSPPPRSRYSRGFRHRAIWCVARCTRHRGPSS